jgi:hypothetical protein
MADTQLQAGETLGSVIQAPALNPGETLGDVVGQVDQAIPKVPGGVQGADPTSPQPDMEMENSIAVPDAGRIPGVASRGNKVTERQAAGGLAAGALAGGTALAAPELLGATTELVPTGSGFTRGLVEEEGPSLARQGFGKISDYIGAAAKNPYVRGAAKAAGLGEAIHVATNPSKAWKSAGDAALTAAGAVQAGYQGFKHWLDSTGGK